MLRTLPLVVLLVVVHAASARPARAQPPVGGYTGLVVFGDSLSDPGNSPAGSRPPAYDGERFSNGPVWAERLAPALGLLPGEVTNTALGFSTTDDVLQDVFAYLAMQNTDPTALHVVWAGPVDLLALTQGGAVDPQTVVTQAVGNTLAAVAFLGTFGAEEILVLGLPELSLTPEIRGTFGAALLTATYNQALADGVAFLSAQLPGVRITYVDAAATLRAIVAVPLRYALTDVVEPAYDEVTQQVVADPDRHLFWDDLHPTRVGHHVIRDVVLEQLGVRRRGDIDDDGDVDVFDALFLAFELGRDCSGFDCPADLNGDETVGLRDLTALFFTLLG